MIPVILESPYAGNVERNLAYARACMRHLLTQGFAPYASHLLYTQKNVLDDTNPSERRLGIDASLAWSALAPIAFICEDFGISTGMQEGIIRHRENGVELRHLRLAEAAPTLFASITASHPSTTKRV